MPLAAERPYTYLPLRSPSDIRFVILHPAALSAPIEINILQTNLTRKRPFEALSYTWGDESNTKPIAIHGQKRRVVYVTQNLEAALRHLRYAKKIRVLWVDRLCINQGDKTEKSLQVMRMGDIFSRAFNVCIWLGDAGNNSGEAMEFVDQVSHLGKLDKLVKDPGSVKKWYALVVLMRRPWFSRRWILQEVAFSRRATVYCGDNHVNWSDFSDAVTLFGEKFDEIALLFTPSYKRLDAAGNKLSLGNVRGVAAHALVTTLNYIIRKSADGRIIQRLCTMETLISSVALLQVTDPRDAVYAIFTLANNVRPTAAPVDYDRSLRDVCKDLINHTVNTDGRLDIICRPWAPICPDLPSWIPQISRHAFAADSFTRINADSLVGLPTRPMYNAGGKIPPARALFSDKGNGFILKVRGFELDYIGSLQPPAKNGIIPSQWMMVATTVAEEREEMEPTNEWRFIAEAFWRTLVVDRGDDGNPPPGWYQRAFEEAYGRCTSGEHDYADLDTSKLIESTLEDGNSSKVVSFLRRVQAATWNKRLIVTEERSLGLAPIDAKENDLICILFGCSVPVVLRRYDDGFEELIGECYINAIEAVMDGQAAEEANKGKYKIMEFNLK